jgi:hypothetical protein
VTGYTSAYSPAYGGGFPLDVQADLRLGGTWTSVTEWAYNRSVPAFTITRGRSDETAQCNPSSLAGQLNNRDARFTARNPAGPYYGLLNRNTAVRLSVPGTGTFLRFADDTASYIATPDTAALDISGDAEWQLDLDLDSHMPCILASKSDAGTQLSWSIRLNGDGTVSLFWYTGSQSEQAASALPLPLGRISLRITLAMTTGTVTWYTSTGPVSGSPSWAQLGTQATIGSTAMASSTVQIAIGYNAAITALDAADGDTITGPAGKVYGFMLLDGIGGTPVASPDFTTATAGAASLTDAQSNVWTLSGTAEFSDRSYRYHGEMSSLPVAFDSSGHDIWVPFTAGGILRRLQQGSSPVYSAMRRGILSYPSGPSSQPDGAASFQSTLAYWHCEDPQGATAFASGITANADGLTPGAMQFSGVPALQAVAGSVTADSAFACSAQLPQVGLSEWTAAVPPYNINSSTFSLMFLLAIPSGGPPTAGPLLAATFTDGSTTYTLTITYAAASSGSLTLTGPGGTTSAITGVNGQPYLVQLNNNGTGSAAAQMVLYTAAGVQTAVDVSSDGGNLTGFRVNPTSVNLGDTEMGHFWVSGDWDDPPALGSILGFLAAWDGEATGNRFARMCGENGLQARIYGYPDTTAAMGQQPIDTLTNILQSCEDADRGMVFEPPGSLGLGYRTGSSLCGQVPAVTFDYAAAQVGDQESSPVSLTSIDDDQYTRNDWTVTRSSGPVSGGSYQAQLDDGSPMSVSSPEDGGAGDYPDSLSVNTETDAQLPDIAGWLVHAGTVNEERYPQIVTGLHRAPVIEAALAGPVLDTRIGDYVTIVNPPAWLPPGAIRQLVAGVTETLSSKLYQVSWNAVPESPYETIVLGDPVPGRLDTDGSTLTAWSYATSGTPSNGTYFIVATSQAALISAGDEFTDVKNAGTTFTVTSLSTPSFGFVNVFISPTAGTAMSSDTVTQTAAAKGIPPVAWGGAGNAGWAGWAATQAAVAQPGTALVITSAGGSGGFWQAYGPQEPVTAGQTVAVVAVLTAAQALASVAAGIHLGGGSDTYTDSSVVAVTAGEDVVLVAVATAAAGQTYWQPYVIDNENSPSGYTMTVSECYGGVTGVLQPATTNSASPLWTTAAGDVPFDVAIGGEQVTVAAVSGSGSPQKFTVLRAVNGVAKTQATGTALALFCPPVLALA